MAAVPAALFADEMYSIRYFVEFDRVFNVMPDANPGVYSRGAATLGMNIFFFAEFCNVASAVALFMAKLL